MMAAKMSGLSTDQGYSSDLVTVTKSPPKKTEDTPSMPNSRFASGDAIASRAVLNSWLPDCGDTIVSDQGLTRLRILLRVVHLSRAGPNNQLQGFHLEA